MLSLDLIYIYKLYSIEHTVIIVGKLTTVTYSTTLFSIGKMSTMMFSIK